MKLRNAPAWALFATSAAATVGYVVLSRAVQRGKTRREDAKARRQTLAHASPRAKWLAETTGHIGKWYALVPAAAVSATVLARARCYSGGCAVLGSSLAAEALSRILDRVHDQRTPPPGKHDRNAPTYPSGHALETTAVAVASSWVLARERFAPSMAIVPVAVVASLVSGIGRLVLDRHWSTDSAAGYCAGIALGSACAGIYELAR